MLSPGGRDAATLVAGKPLGDRWIDVRWRVLLMTSDAMDTGRSTGSASHSRRGQRHETGRGRDPQLTPCLVPEKESGAVVGPARDVTHDGGSRVTGCPQGWESSWKAR